MYSRLNYAARYDCSRQSIAEQACLLMIVFIPKKWHFGFKNEMSVS
ncbi:hypothetical protein HMPREF0484_5309 [Klebsiella pneumoniae subsp. rhinoscleromatis ATCC 13884]|nr:hypothetical protein HMPREF0484_5309 [Klebsiella pneumoniae subsp. rhinoscleromatis ATCC 13884]